MIERRGAVVQDEITDEMRAKAGCVQQVWVTPGPWTVELSSSGRSVRIVGPIVRGCREIVAELSGLRMLANAQAICRAMNAARGWE